MKRNIGFFTLLAFILSVTVWMGSFSKTISADEGIVYQNNFNDDPVGVYSESLLNADWNHPILENGVSERRVSIVEAPEALEGKSLRVLYKGGAFGPGGGGAQWRMPLGESHEELYCSYAIKFGAGFDFVLGGKIPGLMGGTGNTGGKIPDGKDGWSARMMWRSEGQAVQYVYYPDQMGMWGQDFYWKQGGQRRVIPGAWHRVEHRIVMNKPGKSDGIIQTWFDGQRALDIRNICFRDTPALAIDAFYFSTFFGGGDASFSAKKDEFVYFDDFIISTLPIATLR